ncbi:electron transport protein [Paenibacillus lautus]
MRKSKRLLLWLIPIAIAAALWLIANVVEPEYAYVPPAHKLENSNSAQIQTRETDVIRQYDLWGKTLTVPGTALQDQHPRLTAANGAVEVNKELLALGRRTMYEESFGNEVFLTDILGIVDGPMKLKNVAKALAELKGRGTTNLRVELDQDVTIGGKTFRKGDKIDTGFDVAKGAYSPIGVTFKYAEGKTRIGVSCMACHATVNRDTGMVVEGAPNSDLNLGLMLALAPNSAAYFTHTDVANLVDYVKNGQRTVINSKGQAEALPDPALLEKAVDDNLIKWAPGNFDTTVDKVSDVTQIPDMFTKGDHPYSWSGFAIAGPFKGLSTFSNNVHAQNTDTLSQTEVSEPLMGIDKEIYVGTILQNAAHRKFRYDPSSGLKPTEFFDRLDPNPGTPGVNEVIKIPNFPKVSAIAPNGLYISSPGFKAGEQVNAMSAYQNTVRPPETDKAEASDAKTLSLGAEVFKKAQCITCHAGDYFTNNRIMRAAEIGTEPARAKAFHFTQNAFGEAEFYPPDTPVPIPPDAKATKVPLDGIDPEQIKLGFGHKSGGGYKVKGLIGLRWSAPYLHDGGVAVGPELSQAGVPATLMKGIHPDPYNSLKALIDRKLRLRVVEANRKDSRLRDTHVTGQGHEYWVDESSGFTQEQQDALVKYLLQLKMK